MAEENQLQTLANILTISELSRIESHLASERAARARTEEARVGTDAIREAAFQAISSLDELSVRASKEPVEALLHLRRNIVPTLDDTTKYFDSISDKQAIALGIQQARNLDDVLVATIAERMHTMPHDVNVGIRSLLVQQEQLSVLATLRPWLAFNETQPHSGAWRFGGLCVVIFLVNYLLRAMFSGNAVVDMIRTVLALVATISFFIGLFMVLFLKRGAKGRWKQEGMLLAKRSGLSLPSDETPGRAGFGLTIRRQSWERLRAMGLSEPKNTMELDALANPIQIKHDQVLDYMVKKMHHRVVLRDE